jgi:O-acetyl-ADP-ribose deacetylase (regulator of RNase III)
MKELLNGRLIVTTGDITQMDVDAVVNAANSSLMGGGGVDGAIHRAGGPEILAECKRIRTHNWPDGLPTGQAVATTAGELPAKKVIHTVGPVWHGGESEEDEYLKAAYRNSLDTAAFEAMQTVAFPAISTGVYGYPKDRAASIAYQAVAEYVRRNTVPRTIYFVYFSEEDEQAFLNAVNAG